MQSTGLSSLAVEMQLIFDDLVQRFMDIPKWFKTVKYCHHN